MVGKKSEYQKNFSPSILVRHIPIYEANLQCRFKRRDQQFAHTSIAWDSDSRSTSEEDLSSIEKKLQDLNIEEKKLQDLKIEEKEKYLNKKDLSDHDKHDAVKCDRYTETLLSSEDDNNELSNLKSDSAREKLDFGKTRVISKKRKVKRPDRNQKLPQARPATAPSRPVSGRPRSARTPFVSYGAGDGDRYSGTLWTHNVLADTDVYPSAIRAKKNREVDSKKRAEKHQKYLWLNQRKRNTIVKLMKKETADWETEYQKHYPAYDKIVYEKALSSRPDSSRRGEY